MKSIRQWTALVLAAVLLTLAAPAVDAQTDEGTTLTELTLAPDFTEQHANVRRLYWAFFNQEPDVAGARYWIGVADAGASLDDIAAVFADSVEFRATHGNTTNEEFLTIVYRNVLGRTYDQAGFDYWLGEMNHGLSRGSTVNWVAASLDPNTPTQIPREPWQPLPPRSVQTSRTWIGPLLAGVDRSMASYLPGEPASHRTNQEVASSWSAQ